VSISPNDPYGKIVYAEDVRYMAAAPGDLDSPRRLSVKLRYARAEFPCTAVVDRDRLRVELDDPARAPSPGQSLVLYDGDTVVAGGVIALA
jgi:tRNA-specific 2-thiouridylase